MLDSSTRLALGRAAVRIAELNRACLTDSLGRFTFVDVCPGTYSLEIRRVTHLPLTQRITIGSALGGTGQARALAGSAAPSRSVPGGVAPRGAAPPDSVWAMILITPRTLLMEEVRVRATGVTPLTSVIRPGHVVPSRTLVDFPSRGLAAALALVPGVTVSGERPYIRGAGMEQVQPLIDGVPAREPITGQWLFPPPQSISTAEYLSGALVAESGSSLGGVMSFRLAEGGADHRGRLTYGTDQTGLAMPRSWHTDALGLSLSGPTGLGGLFYSGAWQARLTDTYLSYDHALPSQSILGGIPFGNRMQGMEEGSGKLTWRPEGRPWKATAAIVATRERGKDFHAHYSRSGYAGYYSAYDTYTTFLPGSSGADSVVFYDGPVAVPILQSRSTLAFATLTRRLGDPSFVTVHVSYGRHRQEQKLKGSTIHDDAGLLEWVRHDLTSTADQQEPFYAVHGDLPEFSRAVSDEGGIGATGCIRAADAHDIRFGAGLQSGRHGYVSIAPPFVVGSFDRKLAVADGYGYLEDTWYSDRLSWMQVAVRYAGRRVSDQGQVYIGSRVTPAIAFHQPMGPTDALHVQVGTACQFPALQSYFRPQVATTSGLDLHAESVQFAELGVQHHFSAESVAYLGAYRREYSNLVFTRRTTSELEELNLGIRSAPPRSLTTQGLEWVLDARPYPSLVGQSSIVWSKTTDQDDLEVPWSRQFYIRSWFSWIPSHAFNATVSGHWNSGRPYEICIKPRDCVKSQMLKGRLPAQYGLDLSLRASRSLGGRTFSVTAEVYNLLDRRIPTYDFAVHPMGISSNNFLAYYHERHQTGGYVLDYNYGGTGLYQQADNPQTRSSGRSLMLGVEVAF